MLKKPRYPIREQDPLKQGLKPRCSRLIVRIIYIREQDPLKQGLKHNPIERHAVNRYIREQDPLKQGLKHHLICIQFIKLRDSRSRSTKTRIETIYQYLVILLITPIREQDPLKQGLKPICLILFNSVHSNSRARSTKTRIETHGLSQECIPLQYSRARSTKTRIETLLSQVNRILNPLFASKIH